MNRLNTAAPVSNLAGRLSRGTPGEMIRLPLHGADADALEIIATLKALSVQFGRDYRIREFTVSLFPSDMGNNSLGRIIRLIASFVRDHVIYVPDPIGTEYIISPLVMIERIQTEGRVYGDCDDHVLLFNAMALSVGYEVRVAGVHLNRRDVFDHVISQVFHDGRWIDVDLCVKGAAIPDYDEKIVS